MDDLLYTGVQVYVALGVSWLLLRLWRLGQALGRVSNPGVDHYARMSEAKAARLRKADGILKKLLDEGVDLGAPIQAVVFVIALMAVCIGSVLALTWPIPLWKQLTKGTRP